MAAHVAEHFNKTAGKPAQWQCLPAPSGGAGGALTAVFFVDGMLWVLRVTTVGGVVHISELSHRVHLTVHTGIERLRAIILNAGHQSSLRFALSGDPASSDRIVDISAIAHAGDPEELERHFKESLKAVTHMIHATGMQLLHDLDETHKLKYNVCKVEQEDK